MQALQPTETPVSSRRATRQRRPKSRSSRRASGNKGVAVEVTMKLIANSVISVVAIAALFKLLPYQKVQQTKIEEIRLEVETTQTRVDSLRQNFNRYFDPAQAQKVMQEENPRLAPNQRRIVLKETKN
jgi:hypothetical protein